jgi:hypothetical protein
MARLLLSLYMTGQKEGGNVMIFISSLPQKKRTSIEKQNLKIGRLQLNGKSGFIVFLSLYLTCFLVGCIGMEGAEEEEPFSSKGTCRANESRWTLKLTTDYYAYETSWELIDTSTGQQIAEGPPPNRKYKDETIYRGSECLPDGSYKFVIKDSAKDGICCRYGEGSYEIRLDGELLRSGGEFADSETTSFDMPSSPDESLGGRSAEWLRYTNQYREDHGVHPYSWDWALADASEEWAQHIVDTMSCSLPSNPNQSHDPDSGATVGENITSRSGGWARTDAPVYNLVNYRFGTSPAHERALLRNWHYKMGCAKAYNAERKCRAYVCRYSP